MSPAGVGPARRARTSRSIPGGDASAVRRGAFADRLPGVAPYGRIAAYGV
ncbi:hypothetical protein GA0070618_6182 [Micromonospora echinospora]|uniref:Uncharacterized protein n=1 Tax=Micromonospora echinospora TaxID=1877 RepID=A0A1C5A2N7_MICEC|nr:hypothetical protein [Micromonospora echinospora]SCF39409.1 hypothetical protein GA0070618_6182 [Micromonospora echinospora]